MIVAILIVVSAMLGFLVITLGFMWDDRDLLRQTANRALLTRQEVTAYKVEILHHINHLTVRKSPGERAIEQGEVHTEGPAARARRQRGD